jgi:hypothetical protein
LLFEDSKFVFASVGDEAAGAVFDGDRYDLINGDYDFGLAIGGSCGIGIGGMVAAVAAVAAGAARAYLVDYPARSGRGRGCEGGQGDDYGFRRLFHDLKPNFCRFSLRVCGYASIPSVHGIVGCMLAARGEQQRILTEESIHAFFEQTCEGVVGG